MSLDPALFLQPNQPPKYINPFTDYGFKRLFGEEPSSELLIDFLNELLQKYESPIVSIDFLQTEQLGADIDHRKAIFDLYCKNDKEEYFIIELQRRKQEYFKDRSCFYIAQTICNQAKTGEWNFKLPKIYFIGILDFIFNNEKPTYRTDVARVDLETQTLFSDKIIEIYLEMPKFVKTIDQLTNKMDQWLFTIKNIHKLERLPDAMQAQIFQRFFDKAELAQMDPIERQSYESDLKHYRDYHNTINTAKQEGLAEGLVEGELRGELRGKLEGLAEGKLKGKQEGLAEGKLKGKQEGLAEGKLKGKQEGLAEGKLKGKQEGLAEGKLEMARKMKAKGLDSNTIMELTGLSKTQIDQA